MIIRELAVLLGFEVDEKSLAAAKQAYSNLRNVALGVAGAATAAAGAVAAAVVSTAKHGDAVAKASQRLGLNVEALQELEHAASMSGEGAEGFRSSMAFLSKQLGEAHRGSKEAAQTFAGLGVKTKDAAGKARPMEEVLGDIADKVSNIQDPTRRSALVMRAFGRSGLALVPMLNEGSAGLAKLRQEARDLGIVMSAESTKAAEEFSDELERNQMAVSGLVHTVAGEFLPVAKDMLRAFRAWFLANRAIIAQDMREVFLGVAGGLRVLGRIAVQAWRAGRQIIEAFGGIRKMALAAGSALGLVFVGSVGKLVAAITGKGAFALKAMATALGRLALGPVLLGAKFLALAGVVFLVFEDIATFIRGGDSMLGRFLKKLEVVNDFLTKPVSKNDSLWTKLAKLADSESEQAMWGFMNWMQSHSNIPPSARRRWGGDPERDDPIMMSFRNRQAQLVAPSAGFRNFATAPAFGRIATATGTPSMRDLNVNVRVDASRAGSPEEVGRAVEGAVRRAIDDKFDTEIRKAAIGVKGPTVR